MNSAATLGESSPDCEAQPLHPCPACGQTGIQSSFSCCGEFGEDGCCGNPLPRQFACRICQGLARASSQDILRFADETGDPEIYALHEAQLMLSAALPGHPARKAAPSKGARSL